MKHCYVNLAPAQLVDFGLIGGSMSSLDVFRDGARVRVCVNWGEDGSASGLIRLIYFE